MMITISFVLLFLGVALTFTLVIVSLITRGGGSSFVLDNKKSLLQFLIPFSVIASLGILFYLGSIAAKFQGW